MTIDRDFLNQITRKFTAWNTFSEFVRDPAITQGDYRPSIYAEEYERLVLAEAFDLHMELCGRDKRCYRGSRKTCKVTPVQASKITKYVTRAKKKIVERELRGYIKFDGAQIIECNKEGHRVDETEPDFYYVSEITGKAIKEFCIRNKTTRIGIYGDFHHYENVREMMEGWEPDICFGHGWDLDFEIKL